MKTNYIHSHSFYKKYKDSRNNKMKINSYFPEVYPICINLKKREEKKKWMIKQAKEQNIKLNFYTASLHTNPKRGCMESHINVINKGCVKTSGQLKLYWKMTQNL